MDNNICCCKNMKKQNLNYLIEDLREVLNQICCGVDETENSNERLIVSRCLDELIVEYMKQSIRGNMKRN